MNGNQKRSIYTKIRKMGFNEECYQRQRKRLKMKKEPIYQENIRSINIHVLKNRAPKYTKQKCTELKRKTGNSTVIVKYTTSSLSMMERTTRQRK